MVLPFGCSSTQKQHKAWAIITINSVRQASVLPAFTLGYDSSPIGLSGDRLLVPLFLSAT